MPLGEIGVPTLADRQKELRERYPRNNIPKRPPREYMAAKGPAGGFEYYGDPEKLGVATQLMDMRSVEEIRASTERYRTEAEEYKQKRLAREQPLRARPPDYNNRDAFEQSVFDRLKERFGLSSGNPAEVDVDAEIRKSDAKLPSLFNHTFRGKIDWIDRDKLDPEQLKFWDQKVKQFHATEGNRVRSMVTTMWNMHTGSMNRFDRNKTTQDAMVKRQRAEAAALAKEKLTIYNTITKSTMSVARSEWEKTYQYKEGWTREVPKWKPEREKPPEYKPGQALEKIATAERTKATFNRTKMIDVGMAELFPELKPLINKRLSPKQIAKVNKAYDRLIKYLEDFAPQGKRDEAIKQLQTEGQPVTESNIKYIMDQL